MTDSADSPSHQPSGVNQAMDATLSDWQTIAGRHVSVRTLTGSYAARGATRDLHTANRVYEGLERLLDPPADRRSLHITLSLVDPVNAMPPEILSHTSGAEDAYLVRVVRPEAPGEPIAIMITRLLLAHWYGSAPATSPLIVNGIGGYLAAQTRSGLSIPEADDHVRRLQMADSRIGSPVKTTAPATTPQSAVPPSLAPPGAPRMSAAASMAQQADSPVPPPTAASLSGAVLETGPAATSFIAWLIQNSGIPALRRFLTAYDPTRKDAAAIAAYQQPLVTLQQAWLASLKRGKGLREALRSLINRLGPLLKPFRLRQAEVFLCMILAAIYSQVMPQAISWLTGQIQTYFAIRQVPEAAKNAAISGRALSPEVITDLQPLLPHTHALSHGSPTLKELDSLRELLRHPPTPQNVILIFTAILVSLYLLNGLITLRQSYVTNWISQNVLRGLQERLFTHLQRLSLGFFGGARVGDIMSRLTGDLQSVQIAASQVINTGFYQLLVVTITFVNVLYTTVEAKVLWPMGFLMLAIVPFFMFGFLALRDRIQQGSREMQKLAGATSSFLQENLSAQPVIKALGLEERASGDYRARLMAQMKISIRIAMLTAMSSLSVQLVMGIGQVIVLCVGGWLVMTNPNGSDMVHMNGMTLATLIKLSALLPVLLGPIVGLMGVGQAVQTASGSLERVMEMFDEPVTITDSDKSALLPPLMSEIRIENITFGYSPAQPVLHEIDLTIRAGSNVAFVGPSGCGKSTMVNLLLRFYDPQQGRLLLDGKEIQEVTLGSLRGQIGLVAQETFIFNTTLRENIRIARPDASDAEVEAAAEEAQLNKGQWIDSLPQGYDTPLGERGGRMSGGQRQRLAIARALLRDPRILILDEATSALDAETEAEILATLEQATKGRTTISIAHHLKMAVRADLIVVFDAGRIVERGAHADLVKAGGLYQRLYDEYTGVSVRASNTSGSLEASRLKTVPLLAVLRSETLEALAAKVSLERHEAGEVIVRQGEPGDRLYVIDDGQAEVLIDGGHGPMHVNTLHVGDYFGEMTLLNDEPRSATVRTTKPTRLYTLSQQEFKLLLVQEPTIQQSISEAITMRSTAIRVAKGGSKTPAIA